MEPQGQERRITQRLMSYWTELKGNRPFPDETEIKPEELQDIWDSCFLVTVARKNNSLRFQYSYLGEAILEAYGSGDMTGQEVYADLMDASHKEILEKFHAVVNGGEPVSLESEFTNRQNVLIKFRQCLMPLGNGSGEITYILGGMKWKAF